MKFAHILARFAGSAWYIRDGALEPIVHVLESRIAGKALPFADPSAEEGVGELVPASQTVGGIATVLVSGVLGRRLDLMESMCGGCDYDHVVDALADALAQPSVTHVIMIFDTPGGTVIGCPETYARIRALVQGSSKPVVAYTDTFCTSAGYYLASACAYIYATPTAIVGSVGAKIVVRDTTAADAEAGVKFHVFKSGTMKDLAAPYRGPSDEEIQLLQGRVAADGAKFRADVLAARPKVNPSVFETALYYSGEEGATLGLVDRLVLDLDGVIGDILAA